MLCIECACDSILSVHVTVYWVCMLQCIECACDSVLSVHVTVYFMVCCFPNIRLWNISQVCGHSYFTQRDQTKSTLLMSIQLPSRALKVLNHTVMILKEVMWLHQVIMWLEEWVTVSHTGIRYIVELNTPACGSSHRYCFFILNAFWSHNSSTEPGVYAWF